MNANRTIDSHDEYVRLTQNAELKIAELQNRMKQHANREASNPKNWGFSGDMGRVNTLLDELLEFMREKPV